MIQDEFVDEAWYNYYEYDPMGFLLRELDENDACYFQEAFYDGFHNPNSREHYEKYLNDNRTFDYTSEGPHKLLEAWEDGAKARKNLEEKE